MSILDDNIFDKILAQLVAVWSWLTTPKRYNNVFQSYNQGASISTGDCNEITFINVGSSNVELNSHVPLAQYDFISFDGKANEVDTTNYSFTFDNSGTNVLVVIKKYYNK